MKTNITSDRSKKKLQYHRQNIEYHTKKNPEHIEITECNQLKQLAQEDSDTK